jgi:hypothetical protein
MTLRMENMITTGNILTVVGMLVAGALAYGDLRGAQLQAIADIVQMRQTTQQHEARIRAVEIAQASQSSDLRAIQIGINRIEEKLEKMAP